MKIVGITVGTTIPKPNYEQTDPTKGDYIRGDIISAIPTDITLTQEGHVADSKVVGDKIAEINAKLADLMYEPISISSFTHNAGTKERGATVTDVTLSWNTNKTPTTLTLDGESIDTSTKSKMISGLSITWDNNKTWKLIATDERDAISEKTVAITFCNGIYYGVLGGDVTIDNDVILGLTRKLQSKKSITFTVTAGSGQYIYYILPTDYGTPSMVVGGFSGGFDLIKTLDFTNASGYTTSYDVWRSTNDNLGETTVVIS